MSTTYLIDGYNLLHAMGAIQGKLAPGGLEQARARLLGLLAGSFDSAAGQVTVVFDAAGVHGGEPVQDYHHIAVRFAVGFDQADDLLEDLLQHHSAPKGVIVVSDDHRIQGAARRRGATAVDCLSFLDSLTRIRRQQHALPAAPEKKEHVSDEEMRAWLDEFKDLERDPKLREFFETF